MLSKERKGKKKMEAMGQRSIQKNNRKNKNKTEARRQSLRQLRPNKHPIFLLILLLSHLCSDDKRPLLLLIHSLLAHLLCTLWSEKYVSFLTQCISSTKDHFFSSFSNTRSPVE